MNPFTASDGGIDVSLGRDNQLLLSQLLTLLGSVGVSPDDPAADRLDPDAYRDDVDASHEFRRLTASELTTARGMDREVFAATLPTAHLSVEEAEAWVRVIGDARLAIAARRGIVEGDTEWESEIDQNPELTVVAYLGFLQARLVEALLDLEAAA